MTSLPSPSVKSTGFALGAHVAVLAFTERRQPWRLSSPRIWIGTLSVTTVLPSAFSVTRTLFTSPGAASNENACGGEDLVSWTVMAAAWAAPGGAAGAAEAAPKGA